MRFPPTEPASDCGRSSHSSRSRRTVHERDGRAVVGEPLFAHGFEAVFSIQRRIERVGRLQVGGHMLLIAKREPGSQQGMADPLALVAKPSPDGVKVEMWLFWPVSNEQFSEIFCPL